MCFVLFSRGYLPLTFSYIKCAEIFISFQFWFFGFSFHDASTVMSTKGKSGMYYSAPVGKRRIAISLSVCLFAREHISGTGGPISAKFCVHIPCGRGLVLLWRRCDMLCTSGVMDDVTFGRSGPYGDAWKAELLTYYHYRRIDTGAESGVYECLVTNCRYF